MGPVAYGLPANLGSTEGSLRGVRNVQIAAVKREAQKGALRAIVTTARSQRVGCRLSSSVSRQITSAQARSWPIMCTASSPSRGTAQRESY
jgi:hypothetical protein